MVSRGLQALAQARIRLASRRRSGVDRAVAAVPDSLADDGGLIYERVRWRRRADFTEGAVELLARQPENPTHLRRWWTERNILVRRLFAEEDYQGAYDLVAAHRQLEHALRIDNEMLRWSTTAILAREWLIVDEPAAREWIEQANFPPPWDTKVYEITPAIRRAAELRAELAASKNGEREAR